MMADQVWPPPPDLASLKELFAEADVEGLIADDCPADEYDPEAKHFFDWTTGWPTARFTAAELEPVLTEIFAEQFPEAHAGRAARVAGLAAQIARFFGPEAQPQVRGSV